MLTFFFFVFVKSEEIMNLLHTFHTLLSCMALVFKNCEDIVVQEVNLSIKSDRKWTTKPEKSLVLASWVSSFSRSLSIGVHLTTANKISITC